MPPSPDEAADEQAAPAGRTSSSRLAGPLGSAGVRVGLIVLVASFVGHGANYGYYVVAARMLDVPGFADISVLIAFSLLAFMPFNGLQAAAARDVARLSESTDPGRVSAYIRTLFLRVGLVDLLLLAALVAVSGPLASWLGLESPRLIWLTGVWIALGTLLILGLGVSQGLQRFGTVGVLLAGPLGAFRTALLPVGIVLAGVAGGVGAMIAATVLGLGIVWLALRSALSAPPTAGHGLPPVGTAVVALLAFASLTNADLLVAKAALSPQDAGVYASAALLGKVALYAPQALALVLLPRAAAALARGERAEGQVLVTLGVTVLSGLAVAVGLALLPTSVLAGTFGPEYVGARPLLLPLALVMTGAALLNVHLMFAMARGSRGFPALLVVTAIGHALLLALLHDSAAQIITATAIAVGVATLVHETTSRHGALRMARDHLQRRSQTVDEPETASAPGSP